MKKSKKNPNFINGRHYGVRGRLFAVLFSVILLLSQCILLAGCGKKETQAPELIDPVRDIVSYRPVTKRVVGIEYILYGNVVPVEYPCYNEKSIELTEIKVGLGDYVQEGDVVAVADKEGVDEELSDINYNIAQLGREKEKTEKIYDQNFALLETEKSTEVYLKGDLSGLNRQMQIEQENKRYDLAVLDTRINAERSAIERKNRKGKKVDIVAPHSGYVTYVKDMSESNVAQAYENIVVIGDKNDLYVEVPDVNIKDYKYKDYLSKWTKINGSNVPIEEYDYDPSLSAYAYASNKYPCMRFLVPGADLKLGDSVSLFFMNDPMTETLAVGNDSLYREGLDAFVYVRNDETGTVEKRKVETGAADHDYTEIKSGVKEGEMLLYSNKIVLPSNPGEYKVETGTYTETVTLDKISPARLYYDIYISEYDGRFEKVEQSVNVGQETPLFKIIISGGNADIEAAAVAIDDLNTNHRIFLKDYEKSKKELDKALKEAIENKPLAVSAYEAMPGLMEADMARGAINSEAQIRTQLNILEIEKEYEQKDFDAGSVKLSSDYKRIKKNKGGTNEIEILSRNPGFLGTCAVQTDQPVSKGTFILSVERSPGEEDNTRLYAYEPPLTD
ncbi:MAG: efflux RND transporter periplasmic adaptor subunit, partial [Lachnospiraceae bacterium]|nr:efflux RND transporter periplasmic adaptor subunit [Lachnospiraceae bacterium]